MKTRKIHYNKSQLRAAVVDANKECHIISRGEGKTQGILSRKVANNAMTMPKSLGVIAHRDFESMLTKTLPPLMAGLDMLGFKKDYHYIIGRKAPKKWQRYGNWSMPFFEPLRLEYFIHFYNGAGIALVSFNRENSANGISFDYLILDEAKFITKKYKNRLDEELIPAMRGNNQYFHNLSQYGGITYTTDQPTTTEAKWLYELEKEMDPELIEVIYGIQFKIQQLKKQLSTTTSKLKVDRISKRINRLRAELNFFRKSAVFYHEPQGLENMEILGEETVLRWKRTLPDMVFRSSILNERLIEIEDGFYPLLDDTHHVIRYEDPFLVDRAYDSNFDSNSLNRSDCRHDSDIIKTEPLDIALDWGDAINCLVIGQQYLDEYHISNAMYVKKPQRIQDLANKFCDYYQYHKDKFVNLPYDQTAYAGHGAFDSTYLDEFINVLQNRGWTVNSINIGQTKQHEFRYLLWNDILAESGKYSPIRFNAHNTEYLVISMLQAPVKQGKRGFEKDKSSEKDRINTPQEEATHFSDAADTLVVWKFGNEYTGVSQDLGIITRS